MGRITKGPKHGPRGLVHVIVSKDGAGADQLLKELESGKGKIIFSIAPAGDSVHYILQNMPEGMPNMPMPIPGQQLS